jgi:hypothetical protein
MLELFRQCDIFFHFIIGYEKNPAELQLLKKYGCDPSSVIKIVKMNNLIDIKWWPVSASFKIYIEILSSLFTIFY